MKIQSIEIDKSTDGRDLVVVTIDVDPTVSNRSLVVIIYRFYTYGQHVVIQPLSCVTDDTHEAVTFTPPENERIYQAVLDHVETTLWSY